MHSGSSMPKRSQSSDDRERGNGATAKHEPACDDPSQKQPQTDVHSRSFNAFLLVLIKSNQESFCCVFLMRRLVLVALQAYFSCRLRSPVTGL